MTTIDTAAPAHTAARRLEGRIAVVTGGGAGIGAAICRRFAAEGAMVAVLDLALEGARETVAAMGGGLAVAADVSDSAAVERWVHDVHDRHGRLDWLVNNAGMNGRSARMEECSIEEFELVVRTNLVGPSARSSRRC